jgi:hypothetical protein
MADKKNVVLFPGAAPSVQHILDDCLEMVPNPTAIVVVCIDREDEGTFKVKHYCNRQELAMIGARLSYLAGRDEDLV